MKGLKDYGGTFAEQFLILSEKYLDVWKMNVC